jgi:hypothetical protein
MPATCSPLLIKIAMSIINSATLLGTYRVLTTCAITHTKHLTPTVKRASSSSDIIWQKGEGGPKRFSFQTSWLKSRFKHKALTTASTAPNNHHPSRKSFTTTSASMFTKSPSHLFFLWQLRCSAHLRAHLLVLLRAPPGKDRIYLRALTDQQSESNTRDRKTLNCWMNTYTERKEHSITFNGKMLLFLQLKIHAWVCTRSKCTFSFQRQWALDLTKRTCTAYVI